MVFSVVRLQGGKLEFKLRHDPQSWVAIVSHCPLDSDFLKRYWIRVSFLSDYAEVTISTTLVCRICSDNVCDAVPLYHIDLQNSLLKPALPTESIAMSFRREEIGSSATHKGVLSAKNTVQH